MKKLLFGLLGLIIALPGWATCYNYTSATGTVTQTGTPSPTNPIEPVFYKQGNMVLRKVGNYADSYDATTGKITRRVGVKVFDGTENIIFQYNVYGVNNIQYDETKVTDATYCSHNKTYTNNMVTTNNRTFDKFLFFTNVQMLGFGAFNTPTEITDTTTFKQWLTNQYKAGTPVTIYFPLKEPVEETIGTQWCEDIKIATTAYNTAQFNPVVTDLNSTIATIRDVVTNTINQTKAIADLQAKKQTRPDEQCPAGKKCLLVEDNNGVPHWYEIIESAE